MVGSDPEPIPAPCFNNTDGYNEFLLKISRSSDQSVVPLDQQFHEKKVFWIEIEIISIE